MSSNKIKDQRLVSAIQFKAMLADMQQITMMDTCLFKRFMKVPMILSSIVGLVVFGAGIEIMVLKVSFDSIWAEALAGLVFGCAWFFISRIASLVAFAQCVRYRITLWCGDKVTSQKERNKWFKEADKKELEFAASLPDESWLPDFELGGIKIVPGHEHHLSKFEMIKK